MALFSQEKRHIQLDTVLGKDVLLLETLRGNECLSRLFTYHLSLISENQSISFDAIIGTAITVSIGSPSGGKRFLNGIVSKFAQVTGSGTTGGDTRVSHYRATMVPWFWLLSRSAESRIYQNMSVPEIAQRIFTDHGFPDFQLKLQGSYKKREYCVQYRETHFNFVSRLLEDEGIHYFFEHAEFKHKLILADTPRANLPCPGQQSASYQIKPTDEEGEELVTALEKSGELRPAKYALNDFNFQIPNTVLQADLPGKYKLGPGEREIYDYPGGYRNRSEGEQYARVRMEAEETRVTMLAGLSNCRAFSPGYRFVLHNYHLEEMNGKEFVLTSLQHHATQSVQPGGAFDYGNSFTCIPAEIPFRPARRCRKPVVHGSQTAIVVGPPGEEIHVDEHGRVKVQFHWDREGKRDEKSSCWVRVSQISAGAGWGALLIPRIGQEVIVDFLEGDPDRPIITGCVYNGLNQPPYPLPAEKTKSTIKSNSSPGGGGFNELRFEDKKGEEEIYLHGQKDWQIEILNDKNQSVGHDETLQVANNRRKSVGVNQTVKVGANHTETIGANKSETVTINKAETIGMAKELSVGGLYQVTVGGGNERVGSRSQDRRGRIDQSCAGRSAHDRKDRRQPRSHRRAEPGGNRRPGQYPQSKDNRD